MTNGTNGCETCLRGVFDLANGISLVWKSCGYVKHLAGFHDCVQHQILHLGIDQVNPLSPRKRIERWRLRWRRRLIHPPALASGGLYEKHVLFICVKLCRCR